MEYDILSKSNDKFCPYPQQSIHFTILLKLGTVPTSGGDIASSIVVDTRIGRIEHSIYTYNQLV